jgi:hypothetical protein
MIRGGVDRTDSRAERSDEVGVAALDRVGISFERHLAFGGMTDRSYCRVG